MKLLANFINGAAVAMIALGILAPMANMFLQNDNLTDAEMLAWWGVWALILHGAAGWVLSDLQE